nr:MAG TPA: hypothetical protein [Caudoviricetes sp.]
MPKGQTEILNNNVAMERVYLSIAIYYSRLAIICNLALCVSQSLTRRINLGLCRSQARVLSSPHSHQILGESTTRHKLESFGQTVASRNGIRELLNLHNVAIAFGRATHSNLASANLNAIGLAVHQVDDVVMPSIVGHDNILIAVLNRQNHGNSQIIIRLNHTVFVSLFNKIYVNKTDTN